MRYEKSSKFHYARRLHLFDTSVKVVWTDWELCDVMHSNVTEQRKKKTKIEKANDQTWTRKKAVGKFEYSYLCFNFFLSFLRRNVNTFQPRSYVAENGYWITKKPCTAFYYYFYFIYFFRVDAANIPADSLQFRNLFRIWIHIAVNAQC